MKTLEEYLREWNLVIPEAATQDLVFNPAALHEDMLIVSFLEESNVTASGIELAKEKEETPSIAICVANEVYRGTVFWVRKHKAIKVNHPNGFEYHLIDVKDCIAELETV